MKGVGCGVVGGGLFAGRKGSDVAEFLRALLINITSS